MTRYIPITTLAELDAAEELVSEGSGARIEYNSWDNMENRLGGNWGPHPNGDTYQSTRDEDEGCGWMPERDRGERAGNGWDIETWRFRLALRLVVED